VNHDVLREAVLRLAADPASDRDAALPVVASLLDALEDGSVRAAEPSGSE